METIVFDGSTMRHSMSQCHCVSPVPTAVLGWMQVGQERKRLCFLNLEQQEAEGDWEVTGPAKVTHPPQPGAVWRAPCLSAVPPLWGCPQTGGRVQVITVPSPSPSRSVLGTGGHPSARRRDRMRSP